MLAAQLFLRCQCQQANDDARMNGTDWPRRQAADRAVSSLQPPSAALQAAVRKYSKRLDSQAEHVQRPRIRNAQKCEHTPTQSALHAHTAANVHCPFHACCRIVAGLPDCSLTCTGWQQSVTSHSCSRKRSQAQMSAARRSDLR